MSVCIAFALTLIALIALACLGLCAALGAFVIFSFMRPLELPADQSNRINRIRLFWFALTRPELFAILFPWMRKDELDNIGGK